MSNGGGTPTEKVIPICKYADVMQLTHEIEFSAPLLFLSYLFVFLVL